MQAAVNDLIGENSWIMEKIVKVIAHIENDFPTKFGVPRQSGCIPALKARIVFEPEYRKAEAFRGLEEFSHIWLIWEFSQAVREGWSPTVRPPRLGGNVRKGVFATRSPFRPNEIGLSSVKLDKIEFHPELGPVLHVSGADLMNGTPIFDIKPYVPYADSHPEAEGGFTQALEEEGYRLLVEFPEELFAQIPPDSREALMEVLAGDPRPRYQADACREYGMAFGKQDIRFRVKENVLTVCGVEPYLE